MQILRKDVPGLLRPGADWSRTLRLVCFPFSTGDTRIIMTQEHRWTGDTVPSWAAGMPMSMTSTGPAIGCPP